MMDKLLFDTPRNVEPIKHETMKKTLFILFNLLTTLTIMAQTKGRFEVHDLGNFKLHVYYTNDVMADASYIVEGTDALVTMEEPLFKDNVAEFNAYLDKLGKPVAQRVTNYHVGGTGHHDVAMAQGMPAFAKGPVYGGMMQGFEKKRLYRGRKTPAACGLVIGNQVETRRATSLHGTC